MKPKIERRNKMKKNKGFTLIELLAVIVILAIIALIAVPVVMNIINRANKSAFKDSAYGILKAGELFYTDSLLENAGLAQETTFTFPDNIEGLEFKGSKPTGGSMTVNKKGQVSMAISNGKYCVKKGFEDEDVTIKEDDGNCELPVPVLTLSDLATTGTFNFTHGSSPIEVNEVDECATSGICESGTAFAIKVNKTETYKFYVLNDDGNEVTLIMDRNLYSEEDKSNGEHEVPWISLDDYKKAGGTEAEYGEEGQNNKGPLTALRVLKERTSGWTNIPKFTYTLKNDGDGLYAYSDITGELVTDVRARLPREEEIDAFRLKSTTSSSRLFENLHNKGEDNTYAYWTSTGYTAVFPVKVSSGRYVHFSEQIRTSKVNNNVGLRPVITLSK